MFIYWESWGVGLRFGGWGSGTHPQPSALNLPNTLLNNERHLTRGLLPFHQQRQGQPKDTRLSCGRCFLLLRQGQFGIQQPLGFQAYGQLLGLAP